MIRSVDPRTGLAFGPEFPSADRHAVDVAVGWAAEAMHAIWDVPVGVIADGLGAIAAALDARSVELVELASVETALAGPRLAGEVLRTSGQLRAFARMVRRGEHLALEQSSLPDGPARQLRRINLPIGVVGVFAASNFPFAFSVAGGDTASALAAGCAVVVKAHYGHPQTSQLVGEIVRAGLLQAGLPSDLVHVLHGGTETGRALVEHPDVAAVGFTGSTAGGRALMDLAAARRIPIPVFAEQGSLNPVVVAPSAVVDLAGEVRLLAASVLSGGGQFCTKPGLLFVPSTHSRRFAEALVTEFASATPVHLLTRKIRDGYLRAVESARRVGGVQSWVGETPDDGWGVAPTVLSAHARTLRAEPALREEMFGPAVLVVATEDVEDLCATLDVLDGNLTGTVHGGVDDPWVRAGVRALSHKVGRIVFGGVPTGVAVDRAMQHGGPYPASSSPRDTSVGTHATSRFLRPISYQNVPVELLPIGHRASG